MIPEPVSHRRFGAEVKMTDASNSGVQVASVDATERTKETESQNCQRQVANLNYSDDLDHVITMSRGRAAYHASK
jgi:hypothetical protein